MYTLFWEIGAGSIAVQALLEELNLPYTRKYVDMMANEHRDPGYLALNPTGLVPALAIPGQRTIGESAAIIIFLGDLPGSNVLVPSIEDSRRAEFLYWLMYLASTGYTTFGRYAHPERYTTNREALKPVEAAARRDVDDFFKVLDSQAAGDQFFLCGGYSALDIYIAMLASWHPDRNYLFAENSKIAGICEATEKRPAYEKAIIDHSS